MLRSDWAAMIAGRARVPPQFRPATTPAKQGGTGDSGGKEGGRFVGASGGEGATAQTLRDRKGELPNPPAASPPRRPSPPATRFQSAVAAPDAGGWRPALTAPQSHVVVPLPAPTTYS